MSLRFCDSIPEFREQNASIWNASAQSRTVYRGSSYEAVSKFTCQLHDLVIANRGWRDKASPWGLHNQSTTVIQQIPMPSNILTGNLHKRRNTGTSLCGSCQRCIDICEECRRQWWLRLWQILMHQRDTKTDHVLWRKKRNASELLRYCACFYSHWSFSAKFQHYPCWF